MTSLLSTCVTARVGDGEVATRMEWSQASPLVVTLVFGCDRPGEETVWLVSRGGLRSGMKMEGDVGVVIDREDVVLNLRSPNGAAEIRLDRKAVGEFLDATFGCVGYGAESRATAAALDKLLAELTGGGYGD